MNIANRLSTGTSERILRRSGSVKTQKRGDVVVEEVKRWITSRSLKPGDKLPKEAALQELFSVSKSTAREALKSLEVQGLISVSAGANGGATVEEVPLGRTFQLLQNYLFFKDIGPSDIYAVRCVIEPELAAAAVPHLTEADFAALERSIHLCAPVAESEPHALEQRKEDLHFHDIFARACPNHFLGFIAQMINEMLRELMAFGGKASQRGYQEFGRDNVAAHHRIVAAARKRNARLVHKLMLEHIGQAAAHVARLEGSVQNRLVLDSDVGFRIFQPVAAPAPAPAAQRSRKNP